MAIQPTTAKTVPAKATAKAPAKTAPKPIVAEVTVLKHTKGAILIGVTSKEWAGVAFRGGYLTTAKAAAYGWSAKTPVGTKVRCTIELV